MSETPHWESVSPFEFARLVRHGQSSGELNLDEVLEVLRDAELTPELVAEVTEKLKNEGIVLNDAVVDLSDDVEGAAPKLKKPPRKKSKKIKGQQSKGKGSESADSTRQYLQEINEVDLLTSEEEVSLATALQEGLAAESTLAALAAADALGDLDRAELSRLRRCQRRGDQARDRMTRANLRLVVSVAKRHAGRGLPLLDLVQEGNMGLMRAVEKFDATKGFKFSTYATWWIRQGVSRALADQARTIRIPVHMVDAMNRVIRAQRDLTQELERKPTVAEVADRAAIDPAKAEELLRLDHSQRTLSLDMPMGAEGEMTLSDVLADEDADGPDIAAARQMLGEEVVTALDGLDDREKEVVHMRFGLDGGNPKTLEEVAKHFKVTRERVRQIETRTLAKLRHPLRSQNLRDYIEDN